MKAIEQYFHVVLFIMLYKVVLPFKSVDETLLTIQMKAIEQYFQVVLFTMLYKLVLTFTAVTSHTRPSKIFPISKTKFWWTSIKCFHDNSRVHFMSVSRPPSIVVESGIIAQLL